MPLFAHTLLVVNPPTGKLKVCAETGWTEEIAIRHTAITTTARYILRMANSPVFSSTGKETSVTAPSIPSA